MIPCLETAEPDLALEEPAACLLGSLAMAWLTS